MTASQCAGSTSKFLLPTFKGQTCAASSGKTLGQLDDHKRSILSNILSKLSSGQVHGVNARHQIGYNNKSTRSTKDTVLQSLRNEVTQDKSLFQLSANSAFRKHTVTNGAKPTSQTVHPQVDSTGPVKDQTQMRHLSRPRVDSANCGSKNEILDKIQCNMDEIATTELTNRSNTNSNMA